MKTAIARSAARAAGLLVFVASLFCAQAQAQSILDQIKQATNQAANQATQGAIQQAQHGTDAAQTAAAAPQAGAATGSTMAPAPTVAGSAQAQHAAFYYVCQLRVPGPDGAASSERLYVSPVFAADVPNMDTVTVAWVSYMLKQLSLPNNKPAYRNCMKSQREQDPKAILAKWQQSAKSLGQQLTSIDWRYTSDQTPAAAPASQPAAVAGPTAPGQPAPWCKGSSTAQHRNVAVGPDGCPINPAAAAPRTSVSPHPTVSAAPLSAHAAAVPQTPYAVCEGDTPTLPEGSSAFFSAPFDGSGRTPQVWQKAYRQVLKAKYGRIGAINCRVLQSLPEAQKYTQQRMNNMRATFKIVETGWKYE
ncbi:MAG: hypothetical protein ACRETD_00080 [Steroidobacteraceae bacterium]